MLEEPFNHDNRLRILECKRLSPMANHDRLPGLLWKVNQNAIGTLSDAIRALLDAMRALQGFFPHRGFHIFPQTSNLLCFCLGTLRFFAERRFPSCFFEDPGAEMDPTIAGRKIYVFFYKKTEGS